MAATPPASPCRPNLPKRVINDVEEQKKKWKKKENLHPTAKSTKQRRYFLVALFTTQPFSSRFSLVALSSFHYRAESCRWPLPTFLIICLPGAP